MIPKVKRGYRLVYTGRENRSLRKENTDLKKKCSLMLKIMMKYCI